ncbi:hypothetical protein MC885_004060, partial [Smutsia gigantea]
DNGDAAKGTVWCPLSRIKHRQGAVLCLLVPENHFSATTLHRHSFRNTDRRMQCWQLQEEETFLPRHGCTSLESCLKSGTRGMRSSSWIFMARSLNDFTNKAKNPIEGDIHPSSGCLANRLVVVSGQPRTGWRPGG